MARQLPKFLFLESFYGGSHRDFADGLIRHSKFTIDLETLPDRHWKWRMRGAALHFKKKIATLAGYDGLITTGMMGLADLKALYPDGCPPVLLYMHENQFTYPLGPDETMDYQFGFTNITSALAADKLLFNSHTHFKQYFEALPRFIKMMPDHHPRWVVDAIRAKSDVLYPGCWFGGQGEPEATRSDAPPLIIWNHRWEFDKNPAEFFSALDAVIDRGHLFRLALLGERFRTIPDVFRDAGNRYGERIVHSGFVPSRSDYYRWLSSGTLSISTAIQENFGISMIEAMRHGCLPLVPNRLVYPEIIPEKFHKDCIYRDQADLVEKICRVLENPGRFSPTARSLSHEMKCHAWPSRIQTFDAVLADLADQSV